MAVYAVDWYGMRHGVIFRSTCSFDSRNCAPLHRQYFCIRLTITVYCYLRHPFVAITQRRHSIGVNNTTQHIMHICLLFIILCITLTSFHFISFNSIICFLFSFLFGSFDAYVLSPFHRRRPRRRTFFCFISFAAFMSHFTKRNSFKYLCWRKKNLFLVTISF